MYNLYDIYQVYNILGGGLFSSVINNFIFQNGDNFIFQNGDNFIYN